MKAALSKLGLKAVIKAAIIPATKLILVGLAIYGLGYVGLLPQSPFRLLNHALMAEQTPEVMRYLPVFVPIFEMLSFLSLWVAGIVVWHGARVIMKMTNVL
jgi:hypothetical protein